MTNPSEPTDVRFVGGIPSNLVLLDEAHHGTPIGARLGCWTTSISPDLAVVATAIKVSRGRSIQLQLAEIGSLRGRVDRPVQGGLTVNLDMDETNREQLARKIASYRDRILNAQPESREYRRRVPADPDSEILLADGTLVTCRILDVSCSGASIAASVQPEVEAPLALGQVAGKVVRHTTGGGFAMKFLVVQDEDRLEDVIRPMQPFSWVA